MVAVTHQPFDYFLDLDVLSFNALLESVLAVDASRWMNTAFTMRLAYHAENKDFKKAIEKTWGQHAGGEKPQGDINDLIKHVGSGF